MVNGVGSNCFQCPACNELVFVIKNPYLAFDQKKNYRLPNLWFSELQRLGLAPDKFMGSTGTYDWAFLVVDVET